jgi:signal transduction histidine kinase
MRDLADRLPPWTGSIRFRLTVLYSVVLFGLAAAVVGGVYAGLARSLDEEPVTRRFVLDEPVLTPQGPAIERRTIEAEFQSLERLVNERALDQLRRYSFVSLGLLFGASLGVGWWVAGRVLRPVHQITSVAREIQATDLSRRIGLEGPNDELRELADTFDDMLGRLEGAFEGQRRFVHEASHELRNPLAVMRTNLDVALADPDTDAAELRRTATVVRRSAERMSRLVDDLLAYARRAVPDRATEDVDLGGVVDEVADEFRATAASRAITLVGTHGPDPVVVAGDRTALKQALANLVDNAVRLAPSASAVHVSAGAEGPWGFVAVADQGPGIEPDDHEHVFQRFWRTDDGDERRSGLGLAIVRQIAERHGGRVALSSAPGRGSHFVVWLPLRELSREVPTVTV